MKTYSKKVIALLLILSATASFCHAQSTATKIADAIVDAIFGPTDSPTHKYTDAGGQVAFTVPKDVLSQASDSWYMWDPEESRKVKIVSSSRTAATVRGVKSTSSTVINYKYRTKIVGKDGKEKEEVVSYPFTMTIYRVTPTGLTINQESSVGWGVNSTLNPRFTPEYAEAGLSYDSTDPSVVSVNSDGVMTGRTLGEADIIIRSENGLETSTHVKVVIPSISDISITGFNKKMKFYVGDVLHYGYCYSPLHAEPSVTWYSTDSSIATVDQEGTVSFIAPGTVTIVCKDRTGCYDQFKVKVRNR